MINGDVLSDIIIQLSEDGKQFEQKEFEDLASGDQKTVDDALVRLARSAKDKAFDVYSEFPVGSALLTDKGVYLGANIEISGRSTSVHAEMLAAFKAVFDGAEDFECMAISAGPEPDGETAPCGLCQHTLSQFTDELRIIEDAGTEPPKEYSLSDLIGEGYSASTRHFDKVSDT